MVTRRSLISATARVLPSASAAAPGDLPARNSPRSNQSPVPARKQRRLSLCTTAEITWLFLLDASDRRVLPGPELLRSEHVPAVVFEAAAICVHVAEQHPESRLIPPLGALPRAHFFQWLMFLTNTMQPAYMAFRYPETCSSDAAAHEGIRHRAAEQLGQSFAVLDEALSAGPFLLGRYSACDAYLLMLTWWAARRLPESPLRLPRLKALVEAVRERPATLRACQAEGIELSFQPL